MKFEINRSRNYMVVGFCFILVILAGAYALFSQTLQIKGTSNIGSNWKVIITSITPTIPSGSSATDVIPSGGSITNNGLTANFKTNLVKPGDTITYDVLIENQGDINAKLNLITPTVTTANDAIEYTLSGASQNDVLGAHSNTHLYVQVGYKSSVTQQPSTTNWGLSVTLNCQQTNEEPSQSGGGSLAGEYYVFTTDEYFLGATYTPTSAPGVWPEGRSVALKYVLNADGAIIDGYVCTKFPGLTDPVCLRGGSTSGYQSNQSIITGVMERPEYSTSGVTCSSDSSNSSCDTEDLHVSASSNGGASSSGGGNSCTIIRVSARTSCS